MGKRQAARESGERNAKQPYSEEIHGMEIDRRLTFVRREVEALRSHES